MEIYTGKLPKGFLYVPQDNYYFCNPETSEKTYLYSDSATSCIILVLVGKDKQGEPLVALTHLCREIRFREFFRLAEEKFDGATALYAYGANPAWPVAKGGSFSYDALANVDTLQKWTVQKVWYPEKSAEAPSFYLSQTTICVGMGDPNTGYGVCGIDIDPASKDYLKVSNKNFILDGNDRDKTHGLQTLFCIFGVKSGLPSLLLRSAEDEFTQEEIDALVAGAKGRDWGKLANLTDEEILDRYSTTPEYEPTWFCENLRESARFVAER